MDEAIREALIVCHRIRRIEDPEKQLVAYREHCTNLIAVLMLMRDMVDTLGETLDHKTKNLERLKAVTIDLEVKGIIFEDDPKVSIPHLTLLPERKPKE